MEAGLLEEATPGRGYTFTYDKQYMMDRTHDPVSLTMPFREEPYQSDYSRFLPICFQKEQTER